MQRAVASHTQSRLEQLDHIYWIPFLFTINYRFGFNIPVLLVLQVATLLYALDLVAYSVIVCRDISVLLDIPVLTIKPPAAAKKEDH